MDKKLILFLLFGILLFGIMPGISANGWNNLTGFSTTNSFNANPYGSTTNGTDIWAVSPGALAVGHFSSIGANLTGFNTVVGLQGIWTNKSDFYGVGANGNIYHYNSTGGLIETIDISAAGISSAVGITSNVSTGSPAYFWIVDNIDKAVYIINSTGNNQTGSFSTDAIGAGSPYGISTNNSDIWIVDNADKTAYNTNMQGANKSYAIYLSDFGATNPIGIGLASSTGEPLHFYISDYGTKWIYDISQNSSIGPTYITLFSPSNNFVTIFSNITFNCSGFAPSTKKIQNISILINGILNYTILDGIDNYTSLQIDRIFAIGNYNWSCSMWDNTTIQTNSSIRYFNIINFIENSQTFAASTLEGNIEQFQINFSKFSSLSISSVTLRYNNTRYSTSFTNDATQTVSKNITIPDITALTNISFYWQINFTDLTSVNSAVKNQSVGTFAIDDCSSYTQQLFNITLFDEDFQTQLAGASENTSIKITFTIKDSENNLLIFNYSNNFTYVNPVRLCLANSFSNFSIYYLDGIIEYSSYGRFMEFYNFQKYRLNISLTNTSIFLYDLNASKGQIFKITYKDSNFVPISGAIMQIQRKYISEGISKTTEIPKTGTEGYTIAHLVANDVIYNIIVMKNEVVLGTFTEIVANCQNPLLQECNINLNSFSSSTMPRSFSYSNDLAFTLAFDKPSRTITSISSIISGIPSTILLNVTLFDSLGSTQICSDSYYAAGGILTCAIPSSFGNSTVVAKLYKDGILVGQSIISLNPSAADLYGASLIFIALIAIILIIGISISDNPMIYGIMFILGLIVLIALNIIYTPSIIGVGATILWLIVAVIMVMIKGSNRQ